MNMRWAVLTQACICKHAPAQADKHAGRESWIERLKLELIHSSPGEGLELWHNAGYTFRNTSSTQHQFCKLYMRLAYCWRGGAGGCLGGSAPSGVLMHTWKLYDDVYLQTTSIYIGVFPYISRTIFQVSINGWVTIYDWLFCYRTVTYTFVRHDHILVCEVTKKHS